MLSLVHFSLVPAENKITSIVTLALAVPASFAAGNLLVIFQRGTKTIANIRLVIATQPIKKRAGWN